MIEEEAEIRQHFERLQEGGTFLLMSDGTHRPIKVPVVAFELARWVEGSDRIQTHDMDGVTEQEVRKAFGLAPDEYPGDCLEVTAQQVEWLTSIGFDIDMDVYKYSVGIYDASAVSLS